MNPRWIVPLALAAAASLAQAATPAALLAGYSAQAGAAAQPQRGQQFFNTVHGRDWRCASCHGATPTQPGRHASTGKSIAPLAPAFAAERFADAAKSRSGSAATATTSSAVNVQPARRPTCWPG